MGNYIVVEGQYGAFAAYIARPKASPASAVIVLQELFGVNADIRKHCDDLAEQGFLAVAPDLFWRQEPGVDLTVTSEADWQHGLRLYQAYDRDAGVMDVKDTIDAVGCLLGTVGRAHGRAPPLRKTGGRRPRSASLHRFPHLTIQQNLHIG
jgi:carboxymethylenebutenolidase